MLQSDHIGELSIRKGSIFAMNLADRTAHKVKMKTLSETIAQHLRRLAAEISHQSIDRYAVYLERLAQHLVDCCALCTGTGGSTTADQTRALTQARLVALEIGNTVTILFEQVFITAATRDRILNQLDLLGQEIQTCMQEISEMKSSDLTEQEGDSEK